MIEAFKQPNLRKMVVCRATNLRKQGAGKDIYLCSVL